MENKPLAEWGVGACVEEDGKLGTGEHPRVPRKMK